MAADDDTVKLDQPEPELPTVDADPPVVTLKNRKVSVDLDAPQVSPTAGFKQAQTQKQSAVAAYAKPGSAVAPPGAPPGGVVPVAVPAPTPDEPFLVRHRWKVLGGVLVMVVAITAAIILIASGSGGDPDKDKATSLLSSSQQAFKGVLVSATQAGKTDTLAATGREADSAIQTINSLQTQASAIKSSTVSAAVVGELQAETAVLQGFSRLKAMKRDVKVLGTWQQQIRSQIQSAESQLTTAGNAVAALKLKDQAVVVPANGDIDAATSHIDGVVTGAISRLKAHAKTVNRLKKKQRRLAATASVLRSYAGQVVNVYNTYYEDRNTTQDFFDNVAPEVRVGGSHTPAEAQAALEQYIAARQRTIDDLSRITVPDGLQSQHQGLIDVVHLSQQGLDQFREAIVEYGNTPVDVGLVDTEAWARAKATSGQVTSAYSSARGAWEAQLNVLLRQTQQHITLPSLPDA